MADAAPASSQVSSGGAPSAPAQGGKGQPQGGKSGGGDVFDFKTTFERQGRELQATKGQLGKMNAEVGELKKSSEVLRKIQEALSPSSKQEPDRVGQLEQQLDYYLAEAVEAEKRGQGIPLTTNLAAQFFQSQIAHEKEKAEWQAEMAEIKKRLQVATDPQQAINTQAYSTLDSLVKQGLDQLYGHGSQYNDQKMHQFDAVTKQIGQHLRVIMEKKPQAWQQIRRDPTMLKNLAQHFLKQNLPPQAVQIIERENLMKTEMTTNELWQAFREAATMEDPGQRSSIRAEIRQKILERMYPGGKG